ncbi:MAG: hypoxanthine phosphoribosyltransferase [Candidatus Pelethousia sp.]|nr:hypoxanthine phosphoribosyltransferase [Candidatus Pelethousia sp.]
MNQDIDHVLLSREQIAKRVAELGAQLSEDYEGKDVILVCILKGAVHFFSDLSRQLTCHMEMDFMSISSYGNNARKTSGIVRIAKDLDTSIMGRHVLIVEDIMDSGLTLNHLRTLLQAREPASLKICCLLDKPDRRECDITPDYVGFVIPNEFVLGYGLDYDAYYRNLPYVGVKRPDVTAHRHEG